MDTPSIFTITSYAKSSDGLIVDVTDTWMWKPDDPRSKPLYHLGMLPSDVKASFEESCKRAKIWESPDETQISLVEIDGWTPVSDVRKMEMLDGFFWFSRSNSQAVAAPPVEDPAFWAAYNHPLADGYKPATKSEVKAFLAAQENPDDNPA